MHYTLAIIQALFLTISYLTTGGDFDGLTSIALNIGFTIYIPSN